MVDAGHYTAEWGFAELSGFERGAGRHLPADARAALFLSRRLVKGTFRGSRASMRLRKGTGLIDIRASIRRFDLDAVVDVAQCRASGGSGCTMTVTIRGQLAEAAAAEAA